MPSNWLYIDTNFPSFTQKESANDKIETMQDYLFMLVEQLRYTLHNLDLSNMNKAATDGFVKQITEPIYGEIADAEGNITQIALAAEGLAARIGDAEGNITQLQATATGLQASISNLDGAITNIKADVNGIRATVSTKIDATQAQSIFDQSATGFTLGATSGENGTIFKLNYNGAQIASTGSVDLYVDAVNIYGKLTASQIQTGGIYVGDLADGSNYATKTYVDNNAGLSASEVNSAIATYIDDTSITAEKLRGRYVELLASSSRAIGSIELTYTTTGYGIAINTDYGGIQLNSGGNIYLSADDGAFITLSDVVSLGGGPLLIGSKMYGTSLPSNPQYGQLFFLKK